MTTYETFLGGSKVRTYNPIDLTLIEQKVYFGTQGLSANDVHRVIPLLDKDVVLAAWAEVNTKCDDDATINLGYGTVTNYWGNKLPVDAVGHCKTILHGSLSWDVYEVYDKSEHTNEVEISGTRFGDHVTVSTGVDIADMGITGCVIHKNWVAVTLINNTGGSLNIPASQTMDVAVNKAPLSGCPLVLAASDTIDIKANDALSQGSITVSALIMRK